MSTPQTTSSSTWQYPEGALKFFYRLPIYAFRAGMGWLLPNNFVLLTTIGRKSGEPRRVMLEFSQFDGVYYVSSGWGRKSQWYQNIQENANVTMQIARSGRTIFGKASFDVTEAEMRAIYLQMLNSPVIDSYLASLGVEKTLEDVLAKRDRFNMVRIERTTAEKAPPPQRIDQLRVWWLVPIIAVFVMLNRLSRRL